MQLMSLGERVTFKKTLAVSTKFNKAKFQVLHLGNLQYHYCLEGEGIESSPVEKDVSMKIGYFIIIRMSELDSENGHSDLTLYHIGMNSLVFYGYAGIMLASPVEDISLGFAFGYICETNPNFQSFNLKSEVWEEIPKKLLHETQARPANQQGHQKPHFPLQPRVFDPNVVGDGVFLSDVSPSNIERALPAEKKKGRSATFYPVDNTPVLLPVDETQPPALSSSSSSMEPVGVGTEMALLSNILAAYAFITENPERAALYFVSGVCIGLVLTLLALVLRVSCRTDCKRSSSKKPPRQRDSDSDSSDSDDDSDTTSDLSARRHRRFERTLNMNVFTSAEELERAQRLEERERIIREIWMNGQPDIPGTRSLNRYY
ncbi:protein eva-1 A isoform X5 [Turdus rufiventris]|nr:protein eva-1 A isoform X5 [Turdus rufiventris]